MMMMSSILISFMITLIIATGITVSTAHNTATTANWYATTSLASYRWRQAARAAGDMRARSVVRRAGLAVAVVCDCAPDCACY